MKSSKSSKSCFKCPLSGLSYSILEGNLPGGNAPHPIFSLKTSQVLPPMLEKFGAQELSSEDVHLFGCFLISKLPLVSWDYPLLETDPVERWEGFWNKHIPALASLITRIDGREVKWLTSFHVYKDCITDSSLRNLPQWIEIAHQTLNERSAPLSEEARKRNKDFRAALTSETYLSESHCTEIIQKGLRGSILSKKESSLFPELLAKWAARTGNFPQTRFTLPSGKKSTISQHWINILSKAFQPDSGGIISLLSEEVTPGDIEEILEHCVTNIPHDSSHAFLFFKELGKVQDTLEEFKSPLSKISSKSSAGILELLGEGKEEKVSGISSRPETMQNFDPAAPKREDFKSLVTFLQAKKAYLAGKPKEVSQDELPTSSTDFIIHL